PLEELMQMRVVTAASKSAQPISDAPSSVVVLTASDIRDHGWRTLPDALATLPGLYVTNDRNYTYLGARGFLRPADYNSRLLLLSASAFNRTGRDLYYPEFDAPETNGGIARHLDWDRAQNFLVKGSFGGVTLSASHVARTKGVPTASFGAVFNAPDSTRDTQ